MKGAAGGYVFCCRLLSMRLSLISSLSIYIYHHSLLALFYLITYINSYHHSIHSIHLEMTPSCVLSLVCGPYACPPPPGVGGVGVNDNGVAGVNDLSERDCGARSAHSPPGSFAARQ